MRRTEEIFSLAHDVLSQAASCRATASILSRPSDLNTSRTDRSPVIYARRLHPRSTFDALRRPYSVTMAVMNGVAEAMADLNQTLGLKFDKLLALIATQNTLIEEQHNTLKKHSVMLEALEKDATKGA